MSRLVAVLAALVVFFGSRAAFAGVELYTIGPGSYLFARYGHSLLCVDGRCYDYGVPDRDEAMHMSWASIRGEPIFIAVAIEEDVAVRVFREQGRAIERQSLPLSAAETARLRERLDGDVATRAAYAYHPYFANCTTQLRDRLDEATDGRLRPGRNAPTTERFRELSEEGLSGRLVELTALAFLLGGPSERRPTPWEAMFLPAGLRDGVADRFGATAQKVEERKAVILPTSRSVGRIVLIVLAVLLAGIVRMAARGGGERMSRRLRIAIGLVAVVLGGAALVGDAVAGLVVWPEFRHNWALVALLPTDLAMPWLAARSARSLRLYATARAALAGILLALEIVGVIAQPLIPVCIVVLMPMLALASVARAYERQRVVGGVIATG